MNLIGKMWKWAEKRKQPKKKAKRTLKNVKRDKKR